MKIAAYYARVSTGRQEKEETIESQVSEIKTRIRQDGNILGDDLCFEDDGWSEALIARPSLDDMRNAAVQHKFEVLYVWDRSRIARRFVYQEIVIEELQKLGIEVIDLHGLISTDPTERVIFGMTGLFDEYTRTKTADQMRRGKQYKAEGGIYFSSTANYGYDYVPKTGKKSGYLKTNKLEAPNTVTIFELIRNEKLSIRKLIKRLDQLQIKPRKSKRGVWSTSTLSQMLRNTIYIGKTYFNRTISQEPIKPLKNEKYKKIKKSSRKIRPREEWIEIKSPRIISDNLFYAVQEQLKNNSKFSPRNKKYDYLLSGVIYCSYGERLSGAKSFTQHYY